MANKNVKEAQQNEKVIVTVSKSEKFYNENKKTIWGIIIGIIVIALALLAYRKLIYEPKAAEAAAQMFPAENAFAAGNFEVALNGDGNNLGFTQIIDEYGKKAGNAAYMYAATCNLQLGNWSEAIDFLKKYKTKDPIFAARALAATGDAYSGLEDYNTALSFYDKAVKAADNAFAAGYLLKEGVIYEELGKSDKALECYKAIEDNYPQSIEAYDIAKYITRIEGVK